MRNSWPLVLFLAGCPDNTGTTTDSLSPPTDTITSGCLELLDTTTPEDGAADVYYRTGVEFVLEQADPSASLEVRDTAGTVVPGASTVDDLTVTWAGDPLLPNETYDAILTGACGTARITFHTSPTGEPAVDVNGNTYALDLASGRWVEPSGLEDVLPDLAGTYGLVVTVTEVTDTALSMFAAVTREGVQNTCAPTIPLLDASYDNPFFELTSPALPVAVPTDTFEINDFRVAGSFSPNGETIDGVQLRGMLDIRPLSVVLLGTEDGCPTLVALGATCEACPDGSGDYCVQVDVRDVAATRVGLAALEIGVADLDPTCGSGGT